MAFMKGHPFPAVTRTEGSGIQAGPEQPLPHGGHRLWWQLMSLSACLLLYWSFCMGCSCESEPWFPAVSGSHVWYDESAHWGSL